MIAKYALANPDFNLTIAEMLIDLQRDPKAVGKKKHGVLAGTRAYELDFRGAAWRAVYEVREAQREVHITSFGPHDKAYREAKNRS